MQNYESQIMELLQGDTPKQKFESLQKLKESSQLGLAKTSELIYELSARCDTGSIDKGGDYRTVDN